MGRLRFQILASGSSGNSCLVWTDNTCILIDAGLPVRTLRERMKTSSIDISMVDAVVVSHEHLDHVKGIGPLNRMYGTEVYISPETFDALSARTGDIPRKRFFYRGKPFSIGDLDIIPFSLPHDASNPTGFVISYGSTKLAMCTDLGTPTNLVKSFLSSCQAIILESNHDVEMLINGPYPIKLKQRIRSRLGHLSNDQALALCQEILHSDLHVLCFAHLSKTNNSKELVMKNISTLRRDSKWHYVNFLIADQDEPSLPVEL
ncbi:MAG: MBL fold metallo-hydrolase [Syntrophobacterales bacterium]|nr:MBL fold metallo-hydrolase [Syntrophobacterales bacterium]